tara:strand:- start:50 stop:439 length:390 start_codon:yes stop_codon:yes gene_type:complete
MFSSCDDAVSVAKACDLQSNWQTFMLSIYRQVIQKENIEYLEDLHATSMEFLPAKAFALLSERFKVDVGRDRYVQPFRSTMRMFLERIVTNLEDVRVVLDSVANDSEMRAMGLDVIQTETFLRLETRGV